MGLSAEQLTELYLARKYTADAADETNVSTITSSSQEVGAGFKPGFYVMMVSVATWMKQGATGGSAASRTQGNHLLLPGEHPLRVTETAVDGHVYWIKDDDAGDGVGSISKAHND
jgi:hypothetical protein